MKFSSRNRFTPEEKDLGLDRRLPRRDLLEGAVVWSGSRLLRGLATPLAALAALDPARAQTAADPGASYPPTLTGLRGSTDEVMRAGHRVRDGESFGTPKALDEDYDLIVVGAGISGLAAAYFYRQQLGQGARILILENHDDFGGHARRNEFHLANGMQLANGGTLEIDSPRPYSAVADGLLRKIGIDVPALVRKYPSLIAFDSRGNQRGIFLDQETFGADHLLVPGKGQSWDHHLAQSPLCEQARHDVHRLLHDAVDTLPGLSESQKKDRLSRISYLAYLRDHLQLHPQVLALWSSRSKGWWGVGIDGVTALDGWGMGFEGFRGLKLSPRAIDRMGPSPAGYSETGGSYQLHFPDGNATIARLLARSLVPALAPQASVEDTITQRFDYSALDRTDSAVRIRLRSTVVQAHQEPAPNAPVTVSYATGSEVFSVRARHVVLACYNGIIPRLCPQLPDAQKQALASLVKTPLLYTSVAIASGEPFARAQLRAVESPGCYHTNLYLNPVQQVGAYRSASRPDEPVLIHMQRTPCSAGLPEHEQNRAGRLELLSTPYDVMEYRVRDQLARIFGPYGLDPARDILAITVNRWSHGYAPEFNPLFDPLLPPDQRPHVIGRQRFGAIAIANADSGGAAYTDVAIDQAHRAVQELLALAS